MFPRPKQNGVDIGVGVLGEDHWLRRRHQRAAYLRLAPRRTLAAFFLGLGLGNAAFGAVADRARSPLRLYAKIEAGIALAGASYRGIGIPACVADGQRAAAMLTAAAT